MNRERAIEEVEWYRQLVIRKLRTWGRDLHPETQRLLVENMDEVATRRDVLQYKEYADGYYIGQLDEDKRRHGYGIFTRTTKIRDRWTMQAGFGTTTALWAHTPSTTRTVRRATTIWPPYIFVERNAVSRALSR